MQREIPLFSHNYARNSGREAWREYIRLAQLAASRVASSLGPSGSYKMITYNRGPEEIVKVTKDAVEALEELGVLYPSIKILAEAAKLQRDQIGDGVIRFLLLLSNLLEEA